MRDSQQTRQVRLLFLVHVDKLNAKPSAMSMVSDFAFEIKPIAVG